MSSKEDIERRKQEVERLKAKSEDSSVSIVKKVMAQPEVQNVLKKNVNKQTFISGLFMSCLLIGFLMVFNVSKAVLQYNWMVELAIGAALILIGAVYMVKEFRRK